MIDFLYNVVRWSELWTLFIPLTILLCYKITDKEVRPLIIYLWISLPLAIISTIISEFGSYIPENLKNNGIIYNINPVVRVFFWGWFLVQSRLLRNYWPLKVIMIVYILLVVMNFTFKESPFEMSSLVTASESIVLLALCISYFLLSIRDESETIWTEHPSFTFCVAVSFYESIIFFIFLFFDVLAEENPNFSETTMIIYSLMYLIFFTLFANVLYRHRKKTKKQSLIIKPLQ